MPVDGPRATQTIHASPEVSPPATVQGIYWVVTGLWPLLHRSSFESINGPKVDFWLVELVGLLLAVCGATMILARARRRLTPEIGAMAIGATVVIILLTIVYVAKQRIPATYLIDVGVEVVLLAGWIRWLIWRPRHLVVNVRAMPDSPESSARRA